MPQPDGSHSWRWTQTVFVTRGDAIAAHTTDYGPAADFAHVTPLHVLADGDGDTVALIRAYAEKNRHDDYWQKRAAEQRANSTLIRDHIEQLDMVKEYVRRNPRTVKEIERCRK